MAAPLHVKEKSAWKSVKIGLPKDLFGSDQFDGLIDFQELTDYELVPYELDKDDGEHVKSARSEKRKRKRLNKLLALGNEDGSVEPPGKKSKQGKKQTNGSEIDSFSAPTTSPSSKKKRKKTKCLVGGSLVKAHSVDIHNVEVADTYEDDDAVFQSIDKFEATLNNKETAKESDRPQSTPDSKNSKLKTKKKKKRKKKKSVDLNDSNDAGEGQTASQNQSPKKKKKNKKAKQVEREEETNDEDNEENIEDKPDMSKWKDLFVPDEILEALQKRRFTQPTTIQSMVLPSAIRDRKDILGAAETGSGKTLAFGIPLLSKILHWQRFAGSEENDSDNDESGDSDVQDTQKIKPSQRKKRTTRPLALILEPTRELAVQVKKHLMAVATHTDIMIATVVGGMSVEKQRRILGKKPQVIIATPGRLWQLIEEGNEHLSQIDRILCLVVDEADRMVEKGHYEELTKILTMVNESPRREKNRQTFVMSATLTMDISAPKRVLNKLKKKEVKNEDKLKLLTERICVGLKPKVVDLTPKDKVAGTLTELRINCKADEKDLYLYYFLSQHPGRTLVFVNSKDCLRRLISIFTLLKCSPWPLHADMHQRQRLKNLDKFSENSKSVLIASDVAARGLDIPNVDHVIHYQVPRTMENYIHRSGRTARASNLGLSVMLVSPEEAKDYRKIVQGVRNGEELPLMPLEMDLLPTVRQRVSLAREVDVREYRLKKKRVKNNFFLKAAEEMDMIIDDERLLEDMGDAVEQAEEKHKLAQIKAQLTSSLKGSLAPQRMTKYPTKSGKLATKKIINLHGAV